MPKGVSAKGYKMTSNRQAVLSLLAEEGGTLKSAEGEATDLIKGLLKYTGSTASLLALLRGLENIGFIERVFLGRSTVSISITAEGREALGLENEDSDTNFDNEADTKTLAESTGDQGSNGSTPEEARTLGPVPESDWDSWDFDAETFEAPKGDIDYDILLGMFVKAAARGMAAASGDGELGYYKQRVELAEESNARLQEEVDRYRAEAAQANARADQSDARADHAEAERDQLQKNLNTLMARFDKKPSRGSTSIRSQLTPEERHALDALMRQVPTRRGE